MHVYLYVLYVPARAVMTPSLLLFFSVFYVGQAWVVMRLLVSAAGTTACISDDAAFAYGKALYDLAKSCIDYAMPRSATDAYVYQAQHKMVHAECGN